MPNPKKKADQPLPTAEEAHLRQRLGEVEQQLAYVQQQEQELRQRCALQAEQIARLTADYQQLEQELQTFKMLVDYAPDAISLAGMDGILTYTNRAFQAMYGYDQPAVGTAIASLVAPQDRERLPLIMREINEHGVWIGQITHRRVEGTTFPVQLTCFIIYNTSGTVAAYAAIGRDISEQVSQEQALRAANRRLEQSLSMTPLATIEWSPEGYIRRWNRSAERIFGWSAAEVLGQHILTTLVPDAVQTQVQDIIQHLLAGEALNSRNLNKTRSGRLITCQWYNTLLRDELGQVIGVLSQAEDITDQVRHEQELTTFYALVENAPDAIMVTDLNGIVTYINSAFGILYDYGAHSIGMRMPQFFPESEQEHLARVFEQVRSQGLWQGTLTHRRQDGSTFLGEVSALLITTRDNTPIALAAIVRDVTERKQAEDMLLMSRFSLDNAADGLEWLGSDGQILYVNHAMSAMLGYTRAELQTMNVRDIDPYLSSPETWQAMWARLKQAGTFTGETLQRRKNGDVFPVEVVTSFLEFNGVEYIFAFIRDITARKQIEFEQQKLISLIENSTDFIGMTTLEGQPIYLNAAGRRLVGLEDDEQFRRASMLDYVPLEGRDHLQNVIIPTVMEQGRWESEFFFQHFQTGELIPIYYTLFLIKDPQTQAPIGLATVTRDITAQKRAEAQRIALQQQIIEAQQAALRELSTPLIPLTDQVVVMPLIGNMDSMRTEQVLETLLNGVANLRATTAILDITGVPVIDAHVADALLRTTRAVKLLGTQVIITGIRPEVAQTLVELGIDLGSIITHRSLQSAIARVLR